MVKQTRENQKRLNTKDSKKRMRLIDYILIIACFGLLLFFIIQYKTVEQRLAAIDAARAIPDSENAAILYNQLLNKYDKSVFSSLSIDPNDIANKQPWLSKDYPNLAKWFEERQEITTNLLQVYKFEECRFPIPHLPNGISTTVDRTQTMRQWAYFLARSANNDRAEGRIEKALEKYFCIICMGRHSFQQPVALDILTGIGMESMALQKLRCCIIELDLTEEQIQTIEKAIKQPDKEWTLEWNNMIEVERLYNKQSPLLDRLKSWLQNLRGNISTFDRMNEINLRFLADRQGTEILIALHRFKKKTVHWPESLDYIKPLVKQNILIDPQNNGPFVYKLTDNGFTLHSIGINNIDEAGRYRNGADDRPIWPLP
jgi:tetratricopeptide (TPR) repeat protein